jgi:uncharacterized glyoxalase superfamily protein PhnB
MTQRIFPMLAYEDAAAAITFLCEAFGFVEEWRMEMEDGTIGHAELSLDGNTLMLATVWREGGLASPRELPACHTQLMVQVDDVDAHHRQALDAGATIIDAPADQEYGERTYRVMDPEGHRFIFATPLQ